LVIKPYNLEICLRKLQIYVSDLKSKIIYFSIISTIFYMIFLEEWSSICSQMARGSEIGMAPTIGRESVTEAAASVGITQHTRKCALSRFLSSLCGSHHFKNLQVGMATVFPLRSSFPFSFSSVI